MKKILVGIVIAILGFTGYNFSEGNLGGNAFANCTTTTETSVEIGASNSTTILSARSGRSFARIQQVRDAAGVATSTVSLAYGATATLANGTELSTTTPFVELGMDTDHAYQGTVTAIANTGSTTLRVTECR